MRQGVRDIYRNLTTPGRVLNQGLQGRWRDGGNESLRFLCNSTLGLGGCLDVASNLGVPRSDANFAQTFDQWGWRPQSFVVLPFLGPTDDRGAVGQVADGMVEPWFYLPKLAQRGVYGLTYNRISYTMEEAARVMRSDADPYAAAHLFFSYETRYDQPDWRAMGQPDASSLQTLGVAMVGTKDPEFRSKGREGFVKLPHTGKKLGYNLWLQKRKAPLVYVNPGVGSHRLAKTSLAIAEGLYRNGYSVVTVSNVCHPEFIRNASTGDIPGYVPHDARDLLLAMTEIDRKLAAKYPMRIGKRALVGVSLGAYHSVYLSAHEEQRGESLLAFDRYVAIQPPVQLIHGVSMLDAFEKSPLQWPAAVRHVQVDNAVHKAVKLASRPPSLRAEVPFSAEESRYLIALNFHLILRDVIYASIQRLEEKGEVTGLPYWNRGAMYQALYGISYPDAFEKLILPANKKRGISKARFIKETDMRTHTDLLRTRSDLRVILNRNDFLLAHGDVDWFVKTVGSSNVKVFEQGGHLGNLGSDEVQHAMMDALKGLH